MSKVIFSDQDKEREYLLKRMDRFDSILHEYLRANHKTVEELADKAGCDPSSLWRYRKKPECFKKAPLFVVSNCLRVVNASNENMRYIFGMSK